VTSLAFLDFGFSELILVGVVALLVFGGNLPDVMRTLGRNYAKLRQSLREFSAPVREEFNRVHDLPSARGIVSQVMDDPPTYPGTEDFDDTPPVITTTPPEDADESAEDNTDSSTADTPPAPNDDLLDEGPLV